jgi:hypothetical protein
MLHHVVASSSKLNSDANKSEESFGPHHQHSSENNKESEEETIADNFSSSNDIPTVETENQNVNHEQDENIAGTTNVHDDQVVEEKNEVAIEDDKMPQDVEKKNEAAMEDDKMPHSTTSEHDTTKNYLNNRDFIEKAIHEINQTEKNYDFLAIYCGKDPRNRFESYKINEAIPEGSVTANYFLYEISLKLI